MPSAYSRHATAQGARVPSRASGGKGHAASWSISSGDDLRAAAAVSIPAQHEDTTALTDAPNAMIDRLEDVTQGPYWTLFVNRMRIR